jgi:hypothetical protein
MREYSGDDVVTTLVGSPPRRLVGADARGHRSEQDMVDINDGEDRGRSTYVGRRIRGRQGELLGRIAAELETMTARTAVPGPGLLRR